MREILLDMYEKLWNADKDKWVWHSILDDALEKSKAITLQNPKKVKQ